MARPPLQADGDGATSPRMNQPAFSAEVRAPRRFPAVNWIGFWTLYKKEVLRFLKVVFQTVLAPVVTTLLYIVVFTIALAGQRAAVAGISYPQFLAPGLIMMAILSNAFQNSASSLLIAKVQGIDVDFLMPPLSPAELAAGLILGAATRGIVVAAVTAATIAPFINIWPDHWWAVLYFGIGASLLLGILGVIGGIWAEKFDHMAMVQNFIMLPLVFLSGSFYSISRLPESFQAVNHFNPVFYVIDGFRYGFTGHADGSVMIGAIIVAAANIIALTVSWMLLRSGWRLKS